MDRRVVVTGLSTINALGTDANIFFDNCLRGETKVETIPEWWREYAAYNSGIWSPLGLPDFKKYGITEIEQKQLDKATLLGLGAAFDALTHAGIRYESADVKRNTYLLPEIDPYRAGVIIGTGIGGINSLMEAFSYHILNNQKKILQDLAEKSESRDELLSVYEHFVTPKRFNPFYVSMIMQNAASAGIAVKFGLKGANKTVSLACASGTAAIGYGYEAIKYGKLDFAVTGGVEYMYDEYGGLYYAFDTLRTLCKPESDPLQANRPFDKGRSGFLYSQGGSALLILEERSHAERRGAPILAEITGFAETDDAYSSMVIEPSGKSIEVMLGQLLKQAELTPEKVGYINAHGTGTQVNDEIESAVLERIFGNHVPINSTKSLLGHTLGASGAVEAVVAVLSLQRQILHGMQNLSDPVRPLNFLRDSVPCVFDTALSESFGFGGHNAALIFRKYQ